MTGDKLADALRTQINHWNFCAKHKGYTHAAQTIFRVCAHDAEETLAAHSAQGVGDGIALIAAERARQVEAEGWTPEHDAEHSGEELASAAACYATPKKWRPFPVREDGQAPLIWPWQPKWWKPGDRIRELAKAGALVAAEIDRLQRAAPTKETP